MSCQQCCHHWIYAPIASDGSIDVVSHRYPSHARNAQAFSLAFIRREEERPVLPDRATERKTELVVMKKVFRLVGSVNKIARIQRIIAEVFISTALQMVCARLGDQADGRTRVASVLCFRIAED